MTFLKLPLLVAAVMMLQNVDAACVEDNCYTAMYWNPAGVEECVSHFVTTIIPAPSTTTTTITSGLGPITTLTGSSVGVSTILPPTAIPTYIERACYGDVNYRFQSACSCIGAGPTVSTAPQPLATDTVIVPAVTPTLVSSLAPTSSLPPISNIIPVGSITSQPVISIPSGAPGGLVPEPITVGPGPVPACLSVGGSYVVMTVQVAEVLTVSLTVSASGFCIFATPPPGLPQSSSITLPSGFSIPSVTSSSLNLPTSSLSVPSLSVPSLTVPFLNVSSLTIPSESLTVPSLNLSSVTVPSLIISSQSLTVPSLNLSSVTVPSLTIPSESVTAPSLTLPSLTVPFLNVSSLTIPSESLTVPPPSNLSLTVPTPSIPSLTIPSESFTVPSETFTIPSESLTVPSLTPLEPTFSGFTTSLPTSTSLDLTLTPIPTFSSFTFSNSSTEGPSTEPTSTVASETTSSTSAAPSSSTSPTFAPRGPVFNIRVSAGAFAGQYIATDLSQGGASGFPSFTTGDMEDAATWTLDLATGILFQDIDDVWYGTWFAFGPRSQWSRVLLATSDNVLSYFSSNIALHDAFTCSIDYSSDNLLSCGSHGWTQLMLSESCGWAVKLPLSFSFASVCPDGQELLLQAVLVNEDVAGMG
ncbi:hypothetical protein diail_4623 [Diaporthe ilicicola]|nr:hypothetical protein diail_4623 [Diaporthe ilicicola]